MAAAAALLVWLAAAATTWAGASAQAPAENMTISAYLASDERFTVLVDLLSDAGLLSALNRTDATFTLFAPTNAALDATFGKNVSTPYNLTQVLMYHVAGAPLSRDNYTEIAPPGDGLVFYPPIVVPSRPPACVCPTGAGPIRRSASALHAGDDDDEEDAWALMPGNLTSIALPSLLLLDDTLDGQAQRIKTLGDRELSVQYANDVPVAEPDIQVRNGYVHILEEGALLPPGNITEVVPALPGRNFTLWFELVERINATDLFTQDNATIFLPITLSFPVNATEGTDGDDEEVVAMAEGDTRADVEYLLAQYNETTWRTLLELMVVPSAVLYTDDLAAQLGVNRSNGIVIGDSGSSNNNNDEANATAPVSFITASDAQLNVSLAKGRTAYRLSLDDGEDDDADSEGLAAWIVRKARWFDVPLSTGVVHLTSRLLLPADLANGTARPQNHTALETVLRSLNASALAMALSATGVADQLTAGANYTIFAPIDSALAAFNTTGVDLRRVLETHVVAGRPALVDGAELTPLARGATLLINRDADAFTVRVLEVAPSFADISRNATTPDGTIIVYAIDAVLTPPPA
jgi:uncharacterized surface protein with fasciclin (FAS1) repeats